MLLKDVGAEAVRLHCSCEVLRTLPETADGLIEVKFVKVCRLHKTD
jgi:hypothetical protein